MAKESIISGTETDCSHNSCHCDLPETGVSVDIEYLKLQEQTGFFLTVLADAEEDIWNDL